MKKYNSFLLMFMVFGMFEFSYANYQVVALKDNNITYEYRKVPSDFKCNIPNKENALCLNSNNVHFFANINLYSGAGYLNVDKFLTAFEGLLNNNQISIVKTYITPGIDQHIAQEDHKMIHSQGERVYAITIETKLSGNRLGVGSIVFKFLPNNGAPITEVFSHGVVYPKSLASKYKQIRNDFFVFMMSSKFDNRFVQNINIKHSQFLANLRARERAFSVSQNQIHQNNMKALDDSYNNFRQRNATNNRSHNAFIDSIHERRQMTDSSTGQKYNVEGYYDHNYVNPNNINQQIQTNSHLYDPNVNNNIGEYYNELE